MKASCALLLLLAWVSPAAAEDDALLDRLGSLVGTWDGEFTWSGARSGGGELDVEYYLTGGGSAVVENHVGAGGPYMTSVYHRDGGDLRLTHYCAAKNQPRMKATSVEPDGRRVVFEMVDITNLASSDASHTSRIEIALLDDDRVDLWLTVREGGRESVEHLKLTRRR